MTLYRKNLKLSQEMFTIISCFEIALRNAIDKHYVHSFGTNWLLDSISNGGIFDNQNCRFTKSAIEDARRKLQQHQHLTPNKLVAELGFGFWRYLFARHQYRVAGNTLLRIMPAKPRSTPTNQYNHTYVFRTLAQINDLRNRIAHHEPICFSQGHSIKDTRNVRVTYNQIIQLFQWMNIDANSLLYGLDHINRVCNDIDNI